MASSLHNPNKSSIVTSLSTMLLCLPFATPNVVMNVEIKAFRLFVFSLGELKNNSHSCLKASIALIFIACFTGRHPAATAPPTRMMNEMMVMRKGA